MISRWVLVAEDEASTQTARRFDTRENQNPIFRPVLQVRFIRPSDGGLVDAGIQDGGTSDAGSSDAGPTDAGPVDAGLMDGGPADAGIDAGQLDSGIPDGGQSQTMAPQSTSGCEIGSGGSGLVLGALAVLLLGVVQARLRRRVSFRN